MLSISLLTGCSGATFKKAVEQGKLAAEDKDYAKAQISFQLALDEKEDEETTTMLEQVDNMLLGLKAREDSELEKAMEYFTIVLSSDTELMELQEEANKFRLQLKLQLEDLQQLQAKTEEYEADIKKAEAMLNEKNYSESKNILNKIIESIKDDEAFIIQANKANATLDLVHAAVSQSEAAKKEEARRLEAIKNPVNPSLGMDQVARNNGYSVEDYRLADFNKDGVKDFVAILTNSSSTYLGVMDGVSGNMLDINEIYPGDYGNDLEVYNVQGTYHIVETMEHLYASHSVYHWDNGKLIEDKKALYYDQDIVLGSQNVLQVRYNPQKYSQKFSVSDKTYMELSYDSEVGWYSNCDAKIQNDMLVHNHYIIFTSPHEYEPLIITEKSSWNGSQWVLNKVEYTTLEYNVEDEYTKFSKIK